MARPRTPFEAARTMPTISPASTISRRTMTRVASMGLSNRFEQTVADERAVGGAGGAGEQPGAGMGHELVEHVELGHALENLDEAGARVALIADEEQAGVVRHALAPRRPALGGEVDAVMVGIAAAKHLRAVVARGGGEAHMRVLGNHRVTVLVGGVERQRRVLVLEADRRAGIFVPTDRLLLKTELHPVPMFERHEDARRLLRAGIGGEASLRPAYVGHAIAEPRQLPHGVERDLRIIGAGLHREIAAAAIGLELVAVEARQFR